MLSIHTPEPLPQFSELQAPFHWTSMLRISNFFHTLLPYPCLLRPLELRDWKLPALRYGPEGMTGSKKKVPSTQEEVILLGEGEGNLGKGRKLSAPLPASSLCHCPFCARSPPEHQRHGNVLIISIHGSCQHYHPGLGESGQLSLETGVHSTEAGVLPGLSTAPRQGQQAEWHSLPRLKRPHFR